MINPQWDNVDNQAVNSEDIIINNTSYNQLYTTVDSGVANDIQFMTGTSPEPILTLHNTDEVFQCVEHGVVSDYITFNFPGEEEETYCMHCWRDWFRNNLTRIERI